MEVCSPSDVVRRQGNSVVGNLSDFVSGDSRLSQHKATIYEVAVTSVEGRDGVWHFVGCTAPCLKGTFRDRVCTARGQRG